MYFRKLSFDFFPSVYDRIIHGEVTDTCFKQVINAENERNARQKVSTLGGQSSSSNAAWVDTARLQRPPLAAGGTGALPMERLNETAASFKGKKKGNI